MSLSCRFHKVVDSTELCACVKGASLNMDFSVIMTSPNITTHNYYDSRNMASPNPGHHVCTVLYHLYNLKCKHHTRTLPRNDKSYVSVLIVPCYKKNNIYD